MQYSTILGTRENIELQNRMSSLTKVMVFLTIVTTVLTAVTTIAAIKAANIAWPW